MQTPQTRGRQTKRLIERFISHTMQHGKKSSAIRLVTRAFQLFAKELTQTINRSRGLRRGSKRPLQLPTSLDLVTVNRESCLDSVSLLCKHRYKISQTPATGPLLGDKVLGLIDNRESPTDSRSVESYVKNAVKNVRPTLETRKKKIAGISRGVPAIVPPSRGEGLAIRWMLTAARDKQRRRGGGLVQWLSNELVDAYLKRGEVRHRRDSLHKVAESNRSYVRYRWW